MLLSAGANHSYSVARIVGHLQVPIANCKVGNWFEAAKLLFWK